MEASPETTYLTVSNLVRDRDKIVEMLPTDNHDRAREAFGRLIPKLTLFDQIAMSHVGCSLDTSKPIHYQEFECQMINPAEIANE